MNLFDTPYIGQKRALQILGFYFNNFDKTEVFPNLLISGEKGGGKTELAKKIAKRLAFQNGKKKRDIINVNSSTVSSVSKLFDSIILPHVVDKDVVLIMDEASEIPQGVSFALLSILDTPDDKGITRFDYQGSKIEFDNHRFTCLMSTSERYKVFHAIRDRMRLVELEEYNAAELWKIAAINLQDIKINLSVEKNILPYLRSTGRSATLLGREIKDFLQGTGRKSFTETDWDTIKSQLGLLPLGLQPTEIRIMRLLKMHGLTSLTQISCVTGLTTDTIRQDHERFLLKSQLIEIAPRGRQLTALGHKYLRDNDEVPA